MNRKFPKPIRTALSLAVLALSSSTAFAGAFSLYTEASPVYLGNFAAGSAAEAFDASTNWWNPAGLALIPTTQVSFGGIGIFPTSKITGTSTFSTLGLPNYVQNFQELEGAHDGFVPDLHVAIPLGERATFGLSVVSPFGLATKWKDNSPVRYQATYTNVITVDLAPSLGVRLTDYFSAGFGLDMQYARVKLNRIIGVPTILPLLGSPAQAFDSRSYNKAQSYGFGFRVGGLFNFNDYHTRIGVNYQSQVNHQFDGFSILSGPLAFPGLVLLSPLSREAALNTVSLFRSDGLVSNPIGLPQIATLSIYQDLNEQFALLASAVWTGWRSFKFIDLNGVAAVSIGGMLEGLPVSQVLVESFSPQFYRNVWRFAVGLNYWFTDQILVRGGFGYDQTPLRNQFRDVRLADTNRWAVSVGLHYQYNPFFGFDFGYTHLWSAGHGIIHRSDPQGPTSVYRVDAIATATADVVGLSATLTFDCIEPIMTK